MNTERSEERELCKRDVCMYCGGRALGYERIPEGPNDAGNYVHRSKMDRRENDIVLCQASAIFSRERFNGDTPTAKPCISYVSQDKPGKAFCVYLRDGKKITVGRTRETKGPAWLEISDQGIIKPA